MINDELLHKWINNSISESELEIFKARPEYDSLVELYKQTENLTGPEMDSEAMLNTILKHNKGVPNIQSTPNSNASIIPLWTKISAAASIVLVVSFFLFNSGQEVVSISGYAGLIESLPDDSKVELFHDSKISYNKTKWNKNRDIMLEGKAHFSVNKGNPFIVTTKKGNVQVLGTKFLVSDKDDKFEVSCSEGKVKVNATKNENSTILNANESFTVLDKGGSILRTNTLTKLKSIDLKSVIREIEKRFKTNIELKDIDSSQIITSGFQHDSFENAIKTVTLALGLKYELKDNTAVITK